MKMRMCACVVAVSFCCLAAGSGYADWPQWRGARLDGVSDETNLPTTWSKTENVAWRLPMPGPAGSTPIVTGDRIFVTSVSGSDLLLVCVSTVGEELWRRTIATGNKDVRNDEGNSASPSASTDGKHVWTVMANGSAHCSQCVGSVLASDLGTKCRSLRIDRYTPPLSSFSLCLHILK